MTVKQLREKLQKSLVPMAIQALEDRLDGENVTPSDIRLAFDLAKGFGALEDIPEVPQQDALSPLLKFSKPDKGLKSSNG